MRIFSMMSQVNFCASMGTEDISPADPIDFDWDNA